MTDEEIQAAVHMLTGETLAPGEANWRPMILRALEAGMRDYKGMLHFQAAFIKADQQLRAIRALVDEQAEDEGLWALPIDGLPRIGEHYLRQELRRLHALIEAEP